MSEPIENSRSRFTIRTSDRRTFRRCKRKWEYTASLKRNLQRKGAEQNINFWFGSAIHFAMEDYHGWNRFGDPRRALDAYYKAFNPDELPEGHEHHYNLGMGMLSYYLTWYARHNAMPEFETIWFDEHKNVVPPFTPGAVPAVEQQFYIPLGTKVIVDAKDDDIYAIYEEDRIVYDDGFKCPGKFIKTSSTTGIWSCEESYGCPIDDTKIVHRDCNIISIFYHGTMDRLCIDRNGNWWVMDYKTAKSADTNKLDTDDQIAAYLWAAEIWFQHPIRGFIYLQLTKDVAREPKRLKDGSLSADKRQKTTYSLFKSELDWEYGDYRSAPNKYLEFLNHLASLETDEGDRFVRWDMVKRTRAQIETTFANILAETHEMLTTPYCYPNPTRDCIWDCPVRDICLMEDRKEWDDIDQVLSLEWEERPRNEDGNIDPWRNNIPWPESEADWIPLDELLDKAQSQMLELDSQSFQGETGFEFLYERE